MSRRSLLGIVPARGGSKGIPQKNLYLLNGKPLIAHTITEALASQYIERLVISTEDPEIAETAKKYGCEAPFLRPMELAQDDTDIVPVISHALKTVSRQNYNPEAIILLQPTSPLRKTKHIDEAIELFFTGKGDSLVSVCKIKNSPYWMFTQQGAHLTPFWDSPLNKTRRQLLPILYRPNGAIYISTDQLILERKTILGEKIIPYLMDEKSSVDIDTIYDMEIAEYLLEKEAANIVSSKDI